MYTRPLLANCGSNARPQNPRSSNVFTLALRSMNGVDSNCPFLITRTTPFFCHTNRRPSGAKAMPTRVYGGTVAILSVANPESLKVSAAAAPWKDRRPAITPITATRYLNFRRQGMGDSPRQRMGSARRTTAGEQRGYRL